MKTGLRKSLCFHSGSRGSGSEDEGELLNISLLFPADFISPIKRLVKFFKHQIESCSQLMTRNGSVTSILHTRHSLFSSNLSSQYPSFICSFCNILNYISITHKNVMNTLIVSYPINLLPPIFT